MPRDSRVYLEDILGAIARIRRYTRGLSKDAFAADDKTVDAVVRNLEVVGEAVKRLPTDDALIALSARQIGASIVTDNVRDFEVLRRSVRFDLEPFGGALPARAGRIEKGARRCSARKTTRP